jgi:DNA-binding MarR family transcriptional regulator
MAEGPLSPVEYALYSAIFELEAASPTALAERLGMPLTTLVDRLREIETRGHARRLPNPADRRSHLVVLTAAGLAAHAAAARQFEVASRAVLEGLPTSESSARDDLRRVRQAVDRAMAGGALVGVPPAVSPRPSGGRAR